MLQFNPSDHSYRVNGRQVLSVTKVLAHAGHIDTSWTGGGEFLDRGTLIHDVTARRDAGEKVPMTEVPKKWRGFIHAWDRFRSETGFMPTLIEHRVWCPDPLYAGTMDRLGHFSVADRVPTVLDIKCMNSGRPNDWVRFQLVAYGHALNPKKIYQRVAVGLHPDGTYHVVRYPVGTWVTDLTKFLTNVRQAIRGNNFMAFSKPLKIVK